MQNKSAEIEISFITINYNGLCDTCELIESIFTYIKSVSYEIIVVDNASLNNEAEIIQSKYPTVTVIKSNVNLGFSGGNNLGIETAKGKYLFIINNDTFFKDDNLNKLIERFESDKKIGVVCPKIIFSNPGDRIQFAGYTPMSRLTLRNNLVGFGEVDNGQYSTSHESPFMHGAAALVSRYAVNKAGNMPEDFFLYYEELDWSERIKDAGLTIWYEAGANVFHKESQSVGQASPQRTYYLTRNRLRFANRNRKGIERIIAHTYLSITSVVKALRHLLNNNFMLFKATACGLFDFFFRKNKLK